MSTTTEIAKFVAKYTPAMAGQINEARRKVRALVPRGTEFVYDNYNALVFGFGPTERPSEAVLSLAAMPQWVTLCFLFGTKLKDPKKLLRGGGNQVRSVRLASPEDLDTAPIRALISQALAQGSFSDAAKLATVIRSVSAKQRPRRPSTAPRSSTPAGSRPGR